MGGERDERALSCQWLIPALARSPFHGNCLASEAGPAGAQWGSSLLCLRIVVSSANCDSVLRNEGIAILLAWMMWRPQANTALIT